MRNHAPKTKLSSTCRKINRKKVKVQHAGHLAQKQKASTPSPCQTADTNPSLAVLLKPAALSAVTLELLHLEQRPSPSSCLLCSEDSCLHLIVVMKPNCPPQFGLIPSTAGRPCTVEQSPPTMSSHHICISFIAGDKPCAGCKRLQHARLSGPTTQCGLHCAITRRRSSGQKASYKDTAHADTCSFLPRLSCMALRTLTPTTRRRRVSWHACFD